MKSKDVSGFEVVIRDFSRWYGDDEIIITGAVAILLGNYVNHVRSTNDIDFLLGQNNHVEVITKGRRIGNNNFIEEGTQHDYQHVGTELWVDIVAPSIDTDHHMMNVDLMMNVIENPKKYSWKYKNVYVLNIECVLISKLRPLAFDRLNSAEKIYDYKRDVSGMIDVMLNENILEKFYNLEYDRNGRRLIWEDDMNVFKQLYAEVIKYRKKE
ncbi:MAG: hypothetical protein HQM14_15945 [SAR324 cluster bacterium]|nr:hypothetical protein [SAR324 cluster bacterium]